MKIKLEKKNVNFTLVFFKSMKSKKKNRFARFSPKNLDHDLLHTFATQSNVYRTLVCFIVILWNEQPRPPLTKLRESSSGEQSSCSLI